DSRITGDLRVATLYYTVRGRTLDEEPDLEAAEAALTAARGRLRTMVGKQTGVKFTHELTFVYDSVPESARHMEELLARAREQDEQVRRAAEGASPAGDEDPYRKDGEDAPEDDGRWRSGSMRSGPPAWWPRTATSPSCAIGGRTRTHSEAPPVSPGRFVARVSSCTSRSTPASSLTASG